MKCLPASRRNASRSIVAEPVGVVDDPRGVGRRVEVEKPLELRADAGDVRVDLLARQQHALLRLAARIADHARCRRRRSRSASGRTAAAAPAPSPCSSDPTCRLDAVGSKPMYAVTRSLREQRRHSPRSRRTPARATAVRRSRFVMQSMRRVTIPVDGRSPAARSLKALVATGVGAVAGARRATAICYERHQLEVTRRDAAGRRLAAGARRAAHRTASPTSTAAAGSRTTTSRTRSPLLMRERPDLIVLGGDYVTWGDRALRRPGGRSARAARPRRTASSRSSATTTTITTCRRRSRRTASRC